ncbi:hypothetical protein [Microlunatus speluncae]|uniref:hypothetical protein n=1 Tax=Microlunatus speluncae TaxID=2594267 RepID=UPI0012668702|nr:hypothetical protein [Microlunatus speluncae]
MSTLGWRSLWIGLGLVIVATFCLVLSLVTPGVIIGIVGLIGLGMAGYDAIYEALGRAQLRRRAANPRRRN